jgi:hypothetical protein
MIGPAIGSRERTTEQPTSTLSSIRRRASKKVQAISAR